MKKHRIALFFLWIICLVSCKEDKIIAPVPGSSEEGVFVLNEGNFTFGNGSLSYLDLTDNTMYNQIFFEVNGFPLGDVPQSFLQDGERLFIVVNNSGKIVVINTEDFTHIGTIDGLVSPRYMLKISEKEALVSDLYSPYISVVDLEILQVTSSVFVGNSTEALLSDGTFAYAAGWTYNDKLYKIDIAKREVVDSLITGPQPNSMVLDKDEKLWVLYDGGFQGSPYGHFPAGLVRVDPEEFKVEEEIVFPSKEGSPKALKVNEGRDSLFFINASYAASGSANRGIFKMSVYDKAIPQEAFISEGKGIFNGMAVAQANGDIYVSDAVDYQRAGWLRKFSAQGKLLDSFRVDIIPGEIIFKVK